MASFSFAKIEKPAENPSPVYYLSAMISSLLFVGCGGFAGSVCRFLAGKFVGAHFPGAFPFGTFAVNLVGCFLIGAFYAISARHGLSPNTRLFLTTGFCGGFTTFSTFANESLTLLKSGSLFLFALYAGASVAIGILAAYAGAAVFR